MKTLTYEISEGQFLGQLEPFKSMGLPTNSIIHKQITGCGATTLELEYPRNSIIIEPNLPVILGKAAKINKKKRKHKVILGVHEKVSIEQIKSYIENRKGDKKIVTTPEGFDKVIEAIGESVFKDYFLLFDECEKVIQDVAFRGRILDPLKSFFAFEKKAFVSATPILPSDPRFENFTHVIIKPNYVFKHNITVYPTNNIIFQLKKIIDSYHEYGQETDRKFFIFFKSIQRIKHIIKGLKIEDYAVHCSDTSVMDLKANDISNAYDSIKETFSKYNFFTSRFFSAVDFDYTVYNCNPIIIMISDPLAMEHTVIDPATEAIQIIGRFRNPIPEEGKPKIDVVKDIYHITNYNTELTNYDNKEIDAILSDIQCMHLSVARFRPCSNVDYIYKFKNTILKLDNFAYFYRDSTRNHFMVDNFHDVELIKGYYKSNYGLLRKYRSLERFEVNSASEYKNHLITDADLREMTTTTALSKVNLFVSQRVKESMETELDPEYRQFNLEMLRATYRKQMNVIDDYGLVEAAKLDYDITKILEARKQKESCEILKEIKAYVNSVFELRYYLAEDITLLLKTGIEQTGLKGYKPTLRFLKKFAQVSGRESGAKADGTPGKGYTIIKFYE